MKLYIKAIASVVVLSFPLIVNASIPAGFPKSLLYHGKPIDPLCIIPNPLVSITQCRDKDIKITGENTVLTNKGYVGYDYTQALRDLNSMLVHGYSYYKPLMHVNGADIVSSVSNAGGNGEFTSIFLIKRTGNNLHIKSLTPAGDRCNGGIANAAAENNQVTYAVNITASDFLNLAKQNPHHLKAYEDLAACAACCEGKANYAINPNEPTASPTLLSVDLGTTPITPNAQSQGKYQFCFDTLAARYQKEGKNVLSPAQLNEFVTTFNATCVKP